MTDYQFKQLQRQAANLGVFLGGAAGVVAAFGESLPMWVRIVAASFASGIAAVKVRQSHGDAKARANGGNGNGN